MNIRFLPEAKAEFDASADWYDAQRTGLGIDFVARVRDALDRIAANPQVYGTVYRSVRKALVKKFPFVILYQEEDGEVLVISVFHTSRDPSVWKLRV